MGKKTKISVAFISLLIAALFFLITKNDVLVLLNSSKDIYQEPVENVKQLKIGTSIETEIPFTYGCILGGESWTDRGDGVKYGSSRDVYYLIPIYNESDDLYLALIRADLNSSLHNRLKKLEKNSMSNTEGGTISTVKFKGGVYPVNKEALKLTKDIVAEAGWFAEQSTLDKHVLPICLRESDTANGYIGSAICGVCLLIGIIFLAWSFAKGPKNEKGVSYASRLKELRALDDTVVVKINGYNLLVSNMQDVDKAVFEGNMEKAVKKLKSYRASQEEAERIAAEWKNIARMQ